MNVTSFFKSFCTCLHLTFGYMEVVCHLSSRLGLQALDDQHFGLWSNLWHADRGEVALYMKVWCALLFIHLGMC